LSNIASLSPFFVACVPRPILVSRSLKSERRAGAAFRIEFVGLKLLIGLRGPPLRYSLEGCSEVAGWPEAAW
jgi:hypothetical protein